MSRIDELIAKLCPDGVEFKMLGDLAVILPGLNGKTKADFTHGNARFASYRNIFANPSLNLESPDFVKVKENENQNSVQVGDILITGSSETPDEAGMSSVVTSIPSEPVYVNSFCFILRFNQHDILDPDFAKHLFRGEIIRKQIRGTASGVTRFNVSKPRFLKIRIPVPPLEVQREIVRVLDQFTQLEAELEARRRQYEYYRNQLLTFPEGGARWLPMGELGVIFRGKRFTKADYSIDGGIGVIHYGDIYTQYGVSTTTAISRVKEELRPRLRFAMKGDVVFTDVGETVEDVGKAVAWLGDEDVAIHDHCYVIRSNLDASYLSYYMQTTEFHKAKDKCVVRTKVKTLLLEGLKTIRVPVPSLSEQRRIAGILDKFDALVNDLSTGLPAELNARRKQYEYYRDKLLTFRELK